MYQPLSHLKRYLIMLSLYFGGPTWDFASKAYKNALCPPCPPRVNMGNRKRTSRIKNLVGVGGFEPPALASQGGFASANDVKLTIYAHQCCKQVTPADKTER